MKKKKRFIYFDCLSEHFFRVWFLDTLKTSDVSFAEKTFTFPGPVQRLNSLSFGCRAPQSGVTVFTSI